MKRIIIIILFSAAATFSQNVSPEFSELNGMEDQSGNTHLFYRINTATYDSISYWTNTSNNIYHMDLLNQQDTLFLESYMRFDSIYYYPEDFVIADLNFWQDNPSYHIYGGATQITILDEQTFIQRFDSENTYDKGGVVHLIEISQQNDSLLYARVNVLDYSGFIGTIRSTDGGWNWERLPDILEILSLNPSNDQVFLARNEITKKLYRTTNGGGSYYLVDSSMTYWEQQYHYDPNENHIYRVARNFLTNDYELRVSSNGGEAFSWAVKYSSANQIYISNNSIVTGEIYLADGKNIYLSADYGDNLNLYKSLGGNILGIYKKPNSDKLYAATKYKIYEITSDSISIIKSLPIPDEILNYYPLAIGNYWVYAQEVHIVGSWEVVNSYLLREVVGDSMMTNNQIYKKVKEFDAYIGNEFIFYERVDSTTGLVYRYSEDSVQTNYEYLLDDLLSEVGDTVLTFRLAHYYEAPPPQVIHSENNIFNDFGLTRNRKVYSELDFSGDIRYSLTEEIGLDSLVVDLLDVYTSYVDLKGCMINGIVYGDTTVVSVEDETPNLPTEFSLSQNYPNPFNPSTKIKFKIPGQTRNDNMFVTLKVYGVLGNEITTLVNEELPAGEYEVEFSAIGGPASGIYFYQLKAGSFVQTKKMTLLR